MPALVKPNANQRARLEQSQATWQPPGTTISLHGRTIPGGMLYVGANVAGLWNGRPIEPAAIDPKYKARQRLTYGYSTPNYWGSPSYHKLSPTDRASYLDWLASGRTATPTDQQFRLFFYGIERRIFFDARYDEAALNEIPILLDEVHRIVGGFQQYAGAHLRTAASSLRAAAEARLPGFDPTALEPPMENQTWTMPLAIELALGTFALEEQPLPAKWAYSWAICSPYTYLRTVERRCPVEFAQYFEREYHREFGEGILLPNHGGGTPVYRPMSPSFQRPVPIGPRGMPTFGSPTYGYTKLLELIRKVSSELGPFSRAMPGPDDRSALSAFGLLPESFGPLSKHPRVVRFNAALDRALEQHGSVVVDKKSLLSFFPEIADGPTPTQANSLSGFLQRLGFGVEPDPATMRTSFLRAEQIGLYRIEYGSGNYYSTPDLALPLALLSIWSYVAAADGVIAESTAPAVCELLVERGDYQPFEINRLHAHASWLVRHPAGLADARRRFGACVGWNVDEVAPLLLAMAHVDATMTPARIKALAKIYVTFGLSDERLHGDLHRISTRSAPPAQIIDGERVRGFGIPGPPDPHVVTLDHARIEHVRSETDSIATLLHDVFATADESSRPDGDPIVSNSEPAPIETFLEELAGKPHWTMPELNELAGSVGLMAAGAIESLNDRALAHGLEPVLDCDGEACDCYEPTLKELLAHD